MRSLIWKIKKILFSLIGYKTVGVRGIVIKDKQVLLVKHTYMPLWYHVGGGIDAGETPIQAMERELMEEVGIKCLQPPRLFHVYHNHREKRDDYVVFYIIDCAIEQEIRQCSEISEARWFALDELPDDISPATRRRIHEYLNISPLTEKW